MRTPTLTLFDLALISAELWLALFLVARAIIVHI